VIACLILAAGSSRRLGTPKQLLDLGGRPLLSWALTAAKEFSPQGAVLVLGHNAAEIRERVDIEGVTVVLNEHYSAGMSTSLHAGLAALSGDAQGVAIIIGDQPFVTADHLRSLIAIHDTTAMPIVATAYADHSGVPMLLWRDAWPLAAVLSGDQGARRLLLEYPALVASAPAATHYVGMDVDTWDGYERARMALIHLRSQTDFA
jgi:molybdenum cofactor cytidylyltransferase